MAWNGAGSFQRTNGSFSGSDVWQDDASAGFDIVDSRHDTHDQDLAQGINNCLAKDGQNSPTANLPMAGFKHTGVADGSARNQYATVAQLQDQGVQALSSVAGTANAITASMTPAISAYVTGARYTFKAVNTNNATTTLKIDSAAAVTIQYNGAALVGGEIVSGRYYEVVYDGTNFQLLNPSNVATPLWGGTTGGTSTAYTITPAPAITAYATGQRFTFKAHTANGAAPTLAVNGLTTKTIKRQGTALVGAEFISNDIVAVVYDGTDFQLLSVANTPLYVDRTNNRVGIGVAPFSWGTTALDLAGGLAVLGLNNSGYVASNAYWDGTNWKYKASAASTLYKEEAGTHIWETASSGTAGNNITFAERMRIANDGKIGFGTNAPTSFYEFLRTANDNSTSLGLVNANSGSAASCTFHFGNNISNTAAGFIYNSSTNTTNAGANGLTIFQNAGSGKIRISAVSAGVDLLSGATSWSAVSDSRLKKNIKPLAYGLAEIISLNPVRFDYKEDNSNDSKRMGFIAQEVLPILPEVVAGDEETFYGLSTTELIPTMIKAIQQLNAKVEALEARVVELEA
jgi:hypothetical protein